MATPCATFTVAVIALAVQAHAQPIAADDLGPAPLDDAGDFFTGRISAIATSPTDPNKFFVGGPGSGVWRFEAPAATPNEYTWTPLTDDMPTLAIGALAIDPNAENIIYAGTGDAEFAHHSPYGLGLYKSVDSGDTWQQLAESTFAGRCFSRIVIDPTPVDGESPILYAAIVRAGGFPEASAAKLHPDRWGPVGVFKSTNGGATWTHLTNGLPQLSATGLAIDPSNPNVLYAAIGHIFGHEDNGIYKTTDGGATWSLKMAEPIPTGIQMGRISIAVAPTDGNYVYALVAKNATAAGLEAFNEGGFRSTDGGDTWEDYGMVAQRFHGWYTSAVTVSPSDEDIVYYGGFQSLRWPSAAAGQALAVPHEDQHVFAWDAAGRLLVGSDGGLHRSEGGSWPGEPFFWNPLNDGLSILQCYAGLSVHPTDGGAGVLVGNQDNGTVRRHGSQMSDWMKVQGADGGMTAFASATVAYALPAGSRSSLSID